MTNSSRTSSRSRWFFRTAAGAAACVLAASGLALGTATPAVAAGNISASVSPGSAELRTGDAGTAFTVTLLNADVRKAEGVTASVAATGIEDYVDVAVEGCDSVEGATVNCGSIEPVKSKTFTVTLTAKADAGLAEGDSKAGKLTVSVTAPNSTTGEASATVIGTAQVAPNIKGTVTDLETEKGLEGVKVTAKDSKDQTFEDTTDGSGNFDVAGDIAAGEVTVTYSKDGYEKDEQTFTAVAGQPLEASTRMGVEAEKDPEEPKDDEAAPVEDKPVSDDGLGTSTWLLIILGALLVIGGIVAIVMLIRKGKNDNGDDDDDGPLPDTPSSYRPSASQTGQLGVYDAAGRRPGMDSPTMIHNGPLINDEDLARYGSEPVSGGFGPAYGAADNGTTAMYPSQGNDAPGYGAADNGSTQMYPSQGNDAPGYGSREEPRSWGGQRDDPGYAPREEPRSWGGQQPGEPGYAPREEPRSWGGQQSGERGDWGSGYEEQPRSPRQRRYREDDEFDDRPRSW